MNSMSPEDRQSDATPNPAGTAAPVAGSVAAEAAFRFLEGGRHPVPNFWRRVEALKGSSHRAWHGLDEQGRRCFVVEAVGAVPTGSDWMPTVHVLTLRPLEEVNPGDGSSVCALQIVCTRPSANGRFALLCDDLEAALIASPKGEAMDIVRSTLEAWVDDWRLVRANGLSDEVALGLVSELHLIQALVEHLGADPEAVVESWTGPFARRHDFEFEAGAVECKATLRPRWIVHVNGWDQLEAAAGGALLLWVERLERVPVGENLNELVASIRERLGVARHGFDRALERLGASDEALKSKEHFRTRVLGRSVWRVDDPFPRLRRAQVPDAVGALVTELTYELDLTMVPPVGEAEELIAALLPTEPKGA